MQETLQLVFTYVRMIWRFRWLALITAFAGCIVGWTMIITMPDEYQVQTRVFLDTRSLLKPILRGLAVDTDASKSTARLMRRTLLVRPNLEQVARKTDMDLKAKTPEQFERLLDGLSTNISVSGTSRDNIFVIGYKNTDPKLATKVVEAILNIFVEKSLGDSRKDTSNTRQFIERQISVYESRLDDAEERLKEFKQRNFGLMPDSGGNYHERLASANEELAQSEQLLRELTTRTEVLQQQLEGQVPTLGIGPEVESLAPVQEQPLDIPTQFDGRIAELESNLDTLLLQYTEKHPDVIGVRRLLGSLKKERDAEVAQRSAAISAQPRPPNPFAENASADLRENPVYQELQIEHGRAAAELAVQHERVKQSRERIDALQNKVDTIFKVEAELKRLNRDYSLNKRNYEELLRRREALKLGEEAGETTGEVRFNILEPPRVPLIPIGPDRAKLSTMVLMMAAGAGIGVALLLALMRPGIYSKEAFRDVTDLPVLGTISRIWTRRERFKRRMEVVSFAGACMFLVATFGGLMALYAAQVNIQEKIVSLGQRFL